MRTITGKCLVAGTFALAVILCLELSAQNTAKTQPTNPTASQAAKPVSQSGEKPAQSRAYKAGYQDGKIDRDDNLQAHPRDLNWTTDADRLAYDQGYHEGYCTEEADKTGFYNGNYASYNGPTPVLRNGYYGYNAPNPECVSKSPSKSTHKH